MVAVRASREGLVVAGAPLTDVTAMPAAAVMVGSGQFAGEYLAKVVRRAEGMCEAVARMPEVAAAAYPARKIALRLVVDCVKPRFAYFTRVCRPEVAQPAAREFDELVRRTVQRIFGWSETEMAQAGGQAARRPQDGGVGLAAEARRCWFAYLGSWLDSAEALAPDLNVFQEAERGSRVGPRLRLVYGGCVDANPTKLPRTLGAFLDGVDPETIEAKYLRRGDKSVRWQALLMRGKDAEDARRWLACEDRATKERVEEMGGAWVFAADVPGCVLTSTLWQVAMRLRFGLSVTPAIPEEVRATGRCQMRNKRGEQCEGRLDGAGHHACACQKGAQQLARHSAIVRVLGKELKRRGLLVLEERWVEELATKRIEETPDGVRVVTKEARLDLVVRDGSRLWWLDFTSFHPREGGAKAGKRRGTGRWRRRKKKETSDVPSKVGKWGEGCP